MLAEQQERPIAALLTAHSSSDVLDVEPVVVPLLEGGCEYFICVGPASEALHDRVDDFIVERASSIAHTVLTTWHNDETAADVAEFSWNIAAVKERTLLIAALGPNDTELARLLIEGASRDAAIGN